MTDEDGSRVEHNIQGFLYSRHVKVHNFLFLGVTSAYGLSVLFDGPHLGRGTDLTAFRDICLYTRYTNLLVREI